MSCTVEGKGRVTCDPDPVVRIGPGRCASVWLLLEDWLPEGSGYDFAGSRWLNLETTEEAYFDRTLRELEGLGWREP